MSSYPFLLSENELPSQEPGTSCVLLSEDLLVLADGLG